ncbi:hypothetical protein NOCA2220265 [metagenome]|uniref:Uncharacterized protein n=1 Tax=metagenome TaxID=256318 RepID=A0A2P2BZB5_9ZZZZ
MGSMRPPGPGVSVLFSVTIRLSGGFYRCLGNSRET